MKAIRKFGSVLILCSVFILVACNLESENNKPKLIAFESAIKLLDNCKNCVLFEISKADSYQKGHLKNANHLWRDDYENKSKSLKGFRATKKELEKLLSKFGVNENTKIILYDDRGSLNATRFAWQLELFNFNNYLIIDGGKKTAQINNYALSKTAPKLQTKSNFKFKTNAENEVLLATSKDVLSSLTKQNSLIIDTRTLTEFNGDPFEKDGKIYKFKKGAFNRGAILNAINYDWGNAVLLYNNHKFKSAEILNFDFNNLGIKDKDQEIILYCQSGARSAHTYFVLKHLLGFKNVKNYDGSWIEWSYLNKQDYQKYPIVQNTNINSFEIEYQKLKELQNE